MGTDDRRRRRRRLAVAALGALAVLAGAGIYAAVSTTGAVAGNVLTGRDHTPAPAFSLPELTDPARTVTLAELRGHDVVLNFWASWCYPCQAEMPALQAAHQADPNVRFVGIDTNDSRSAALGFLRRVHVSYVTLFDPGGQAATAYGLIGLPRTVFVSADGVLVGRHDGELDAATLAAALHQAFGPGG